MSGERLPEILVYDFLLARLAKDEEHAHLLVRRLPRRELLEFATSLAGITLESLSELLAATGHADPEGFVRDLLERASKEAVDRVTVQLEYRIPLDPPAA